MENQPAPEVNAEVLLQQLKTSLGNAASRSAYSVSERDPALVQSVEKNYGARAIRAGRCLDELLAGSTAWELFEPPVPRRSRLPRLHELSQCAPLLNIMRESGELGDRERAFVQKDAKLAALWQDSTLTDEQRRLQTESEYSHYRDTLSKISAAYRPKYEHLKRAVQGDAIPLTGPRVSVRTMLQPPLIATFYSACHTADVNTFRQPAVGNIDRNSRELRNGGNAVVVRSGESGSGEIALGMLDPMTWDVLTIAMVAFFVRTSGTSTDNSFPFQIDDYFLWRGVDARKRTRALHAQINDRLKFLFSDQLVAECESSLWITDPMSSRRVKTVSSTAGPFLYSHAPLVRHKNSANADDQVPEGYIVSLGEWARSYVATRSMRGVFVRHLAEYDLQRQQWERRIGWYLVFQMFNQRRRMQFEAFEHRGTIKTAVKPQHPLKMSTVLVGSHVSWQDMAITNPGKVIRQWLDALETLHRDGVIGPYMCLDGAIDGSDLPSRGRLVEMLERRIEFVPGTLLMPHFRARQ